MKVLGPPRASRWTSALGAACVGSLLAACGGDGLGPACTMEARAGITVEVVDGAERSPLADGSTLTLTEGSYTETVTESFDGRSLSGAWERPGTYDVRVDRDGYAPWRTAEVNVTADECHVRTVTLTASMVALPAS